MISSTPITLFSNRLEFLQKFKFDIEAYLRIYKYSLTLSDAMIEQLSYQIGNTYVSPESRDMQHMTKLAFEIERSLARIYSVELLLRGEESDYQEFVQAQHNKLSWERFRALSVELKSFDAETLQVIKIGCFLGMTDSLKSEVMSVHKEQKFSEDTEVFLSEFAVLLKQDKRLLALTKDLNERQLNLIEKMYFPRFHMRQIYSTEGANNMTKTFAEAIRSGNFSATDFQIWKWRWLTNCFGFESGPGARFYDNETDAIFCDATKELEKSFKDPDFVFLPSYLKRNAELLSEEAAEEKTSILKENDKIFLGHLVAFIRYFHNVDFQQKAVRQALLEGYQAFLNQFSQYNDLASNYVKFCEDPDSVTPTYVPGAMNNVLLIFKNDLKQDDASALKNTTQFMCQVLAQLHQKPLQKLMLGREFAMKDNLLKLVKAWCENAETIEFTLNDRMQMVGAVKETPAPVVSVSKVGMRL